jgi:aryl-alcohol dehydrogenase-like predicted oxidoreductase
MDDLPLSEIAVNELPYNLLCRAIEYDTLPYSAEKGIGVIGYMALLQGILADVFSTLSDVPVWQRRTRHFNSKSTKECRHGEEGFEEETNIALQEIRNICKDTGLTMPEIAVKWILENQGVTCALIGSRNLKELEANVKAIEEPLSVDIKSELDQITFPVMEKLGNHFDYYESAENDRTL